MDAMKKCFAEAAVCAVVFVGVVSADGGVAGANLTLSCGARITTNTTLHADLVNCTGDGIVIGVAGVTLDLNGHRIDGDAITGTAWTTSASGTMASRTSPSEAAPCRNSTSASP